MVDDLTQRDDVQKLDEFYGEDVIESTANDRDLYVSTIGDNSESFESTAAFGRFAASFVDDIEFAYVSDVDGHCFNVVDDGESRLDDLEDALDMAYVDDIEQSSEKYYTVSPSVRNGFWQDMWDMKRVRNDGFVVDSIRFTEGAKHVTFMDTEVEE
jgi:hypothetical protein